MMIVMSTQQITRPHKTVRHVSKTSARKFKSLRNTWKMQQINHRPKRHQSFIRNRNLNKQRAAKAKTHKTTMIVLGRWNKGLTRFWQILNMKPKATSSQKPLPISTERRSLLANTSSSRSMIECSLTVRTRTSRKIAMTLLIWSLGQMFLANAKKNRQSLKSKVSRQNEAKPTSWCANQTQPQRSSRRSLWTSLVRDRGKQQFKDRWLVTMATSKRDVWPINWASKAPVNVLNLTRQQNGNK